MAGSANRGKEKGPKGAISAMMKHQVESASIRGDIASPPLTPASQTSLR